MNTSIFIKKGREKPVVNQHPWVFSGAIDHIEGETAPGDIVDVKSRDGTFLARGTFNPKSEIRVRLLTWDDEPIDETWWKKSIVRAVQMRASLATSGLNAYRLINAENDFIPGLIADRYGDWISIEALILGIDQRKHELAALLVEAVNALTPDHPIRGVYERSDVDIRRKEGLEMHTGLLWGEEPADAIEINEHLRINVDIRHGHKTGFYLDQRPNRLLLSELVQREYAPESTPTVLNMFSFTGGFGLHAMKAGASVINVDSSYEALEAAEANTLLNQLPMDKVEFIQADAFEYLRDSARESALHDIVILDPPKFAQSQNQVESAARGYKDINLHSFQCVKPGGYVMTFSCSGAISTDLFQKIVFGALADSGRQAQIVRHLGPGDDHPVALTFPEGAYLKGLLLKVY